jgi:hypothetical protein
MFAVCAALLAAGCGADGNDEFEQRTDDEIAHTGTVTQASTWCGSIEYAQGIRRPVDPRSASFKCSCGNPTARPLGGGRYEIQAHYCVRRDGTYFLYPHRNHPQYCSGGDFSNNDGLIVCSP